MSHKIHWKYFALLLVPSLVILLLGVWLTAYSHSRSLETMQKDVEMSNQRTMESIADNIDTLLNHGTLSAINLSFQIEAMENSNASQIAMYNAAVDQLIFMQLNSESLLNTVVDRCYVFLFDENRVITQSSTLPTAEDFYQQYFRVNNGDYSSFRHTFTHRYYAGEILPETPIGYLDSIHNEWLLVQTVPADPTQTPRGVIIFSLDRRVLMQRLKDGLADADSMCMLLTEDGETLLTQGKNNHWSSEQVQHLLQGVSLETSGIHYLTLEDRQDYLVTIVPCSAGTIISAQPASTVFLGVNNYSTSILIMTLGMIMLAITVAILFTHQNANAMKRVINSIPYEHQSANATNVFAYMEEAIFNAQRKEALLTARDSQQRMVLRSICLKRLLRGEWQAESDILNEQLQAGISLEAAAYVVLLIHFWQSDDADEEMQILQQTLSKEFGEEQAFLVRMSSDNVACLLLSDDVDLRESIEAISEEFSANLHVTTLVSSTVMSLADVPQAYRQVRTMSRMVQQDENSLQWYSELFQDDVLYNFEYSVYTETGLRNNIAAGNEQGTQELLKELYEKSQKNSIYSDHVLRFFAYDLYRLVNHLGAGGNTAERKEDLNQLRRMLDAVMEDAKRFDAFFDEIKKYCIQLCRQNQNRQADNGNDMLKRVKDYIDNHFDDPELSVGSIADDLNVSSKYLSLFFKEQTGGKISTYIENKRIAHACSLLDTTDMTINDVALASGYALTHTFRVAFKRVQGVTPLEWKKSRQL